jgi:environmental stress-induced protein Ves
MLACTTVRTADIAAEPWRNGGGVTRRLLARPAGEAWQVRVSVADVATHGPFSPFPGVDRWFAVIDGAGVVLTIAGVEHRLGRDDAPFRFSGDTATRCRLVDGPTRDLNLMLRGVAGAMRRVVAAAPWRPDASECGLYAASAGRCRTSPRSEGDDDVGAAMPAHALRWWPRAPDEIDFDGAGWWLSAKREESP